MLRVRLLGRLQLNGEVAGVNVPAGKPARLLLGWLAAFPGEHARAEVAARLWPDVLDSSARASLRTALSEVRAALGPAAVHVRATRETVALGGHGLWVDAREFSELTGAGRWEEALALCRGDVLVGLDEEWVLQARSRHAAQRADAAVALVRAASGAGDIGSALTWARRLAAWDPLDQAAERELMLALAAAGDGAAALRSYAEFSRSSLTQPRSPGHSCCTGAAKRSRRRRTSRWRRRWRRSRFPTSSRRALRSPRPAGQASRRPTPRSTVPACSTPSPSGSRSSPPHSRSRSCSTICTGRIGPRCFSCAAWRHGRGASPCCCSGAPATSSCNRGTRSRTRSPRSGATGQSSAWHCTGSTRRPLRRSSRV